MKPAINREVTVKTRAPNCLMQIEENVYHGRVVPVRWLNDNQFAMSTGIQDFPVRVLEWTNVIELDGEPVSHEPRTAITTVQVQGKPNPKTGKANVYDVRVQNGRGISCSCPGFNFRHTCHHLEAV
jgi:hypothetical protein